MRIGINLLIGNLPSIAMASMAVFLIHEGHDPLIWGWFLLLAWLFGVVPASKDGTHD